MNRAISARASRVSTTAALVFKDFLPSFGCARYSMRPIVTD